MFLEDVLGTRAKVAIVRYLTRNPGGAWSGTQLARALAMSPNTIHRALQELSTTGLISVTEGPMAHSVEFADDTPLAHALKALFSSEARLGADITDALRRVMPPGVAAVLFGSVARGAFHAASDVDLLIAARTADDAVDASLAARRALRRVAPLPLRSIHLTPADIGRSRREPWLRAALREGIQLTKLRVEDIA